MSPDWSTDLDTDLEADWVEDSEPEDIDASGVWYGEDADTDDEVDDDAEPAEVAVALPPLSVEAAARYGKGCRGLTDAVTIRGQRFDVGVEQFLRSRGVDTDDPATMALIRRLEDGDQTPPGFAPITPSLLLGAFAVAYTSAGTPVDAVEWRLAPDKPKQDEWGKPIGKYLGRKGGGSILTVPPMHHALWKTGMYRRVWLQEGDFQSYVAARYAPVGTLVVTLRGVHGWVSGGVPNSHLGRLVKGREVVIVADADATAKRAVASGVAGLMKAVKVGGAKSVRWGSVPGSGAAGTDDYLLSLDAAERVDAAARLISTKATSPRPPKVRRQTTAHGMARYGLDPKPEFGCWYGWGSVDENGQEAPGNAVTDWIATVDAVRLISGAGETPSVVYRLAVRFAVSDGEEKSLTRVMGPYSVDVPLEALQDIPTWLSPVGDGLGAGAVVPKQLGELIYQSIRMSAMSAPRERAIARTGWVHDEAEGDWVYAMPNGAITTEGIADTPVADVTGVLRAETAAETPATVADIRATLAFIRRWKRRDAVDAIAGALFFAPTGVEPDGGLVVWGPPASGKSFTVRLLMSMVGSCWLPSRKAGNTFEATPNGVEAAAGSYAHHHVSFLDDFNLPESDRQRDTALEAVRRVSRISYDGPAAKRTRSGWDSKTNSAVLAEKEMSFPQILITAETPLADALGQSSSEQRMMQVEVKADDLGSGTLRELEPMLAGHNFLNRTWTSYVGWLAGQIPRTSRGLINRIESEHRALAVHVEPLLRKAGAQPSSERDLGAPARFVLGWNRFLQFAVHAGAITNAEREAELAGVIPRLARAITVTATARKDATEASIPRLIRSALASGRVRLDGDPMADEHKPVLGKVLTSGAWAIIPSELAALTSDQRRRGGHSISLRTAMSAIAERSEAPMRTVKIGGSGVWCYVISADAMREEGTDDL